MRVEVVMRSRSVPMQTFRPRGGRMPRALIFLSLKTQASAGCPRLDSSVPQIHKRVPRPFAPLFYAKGRDFHEPSLTTEQIGTPPEGKSCHGLLSGLCRTT